MLGLTPLGFIHTFISLIAVTAGFYTLATHRTIAWDPRSGKLYIVTTVLTCLTGFGIFQHGGFGPPHALGILTLLVLALAAWAERRPDPGPAPYIATLGYSLTLFFHMIPAFTETGTRLPAGAPAFSGPEDPALQGLIAAAFVVYLIGATLQLRRLRAERLSGFAARRSYT